MSTYSSSFCAKSKTVSGAIRLLGAALWVAALAPVALGEEKVQLLCGFENAQEMQLWELQQKSGTLSDQHVTQGKGSLKVAGQEYMVSLKLPGDWSGYDSLNLDIFVEGDAPVAGSLLIADRLWEEKGGGGYWNRHNGSFNLKPGVNTVSIPVNGLYRGEAGSRNNDLKMNLDPSKIIRLDFGFKGQGTLYLDNLRLVKEDRPEGIVAFDFGPESQVVFPGFSVISGNTIYGKNGAKAGLRSEGSSGDDTFPTRLYQDFVAMDGNEFIVDLPNGNYHVWGMFDDLGYWGGEQAMHRKRSITVDNQALWSEDRGEDGPADYLWAFESVEPKPGDSMWDLYMTRLFRPWQFDAKVSDGELRLRFDSDSAGRACKVAAVVIYPEVQKEQGQKWVAELEQRNRKEFEDRATFMGPVQKPLDVPADAKAKGYWLGFPALDQELRLVDAPGPAGKMSRIAAQGQRISMTFAVRPLQLASAADALVTLSCSDLKGPGGSIAGSQVDLRYVQHSTRRGFNNIAYTIEPESLRHVAGSKLALRNDQTRQFWITVQVPQAAAPGMYSGDVTLKAGTLEERLPLSVEVLPFRLDEPVFAMGFYGLNVPREVQQRWGDRALHELLVTLKENGMNTFSGGPEVQLKGFDANGRPMLDFAECDRFFKIVRDAGIEEATCYGGPGMVSGLHGHYVVGDVGRAWEKKLNKPFGEILASVWAVVRDHAKEQNWPKILYSFTDEPRVMDTVKAQLELMKLYRQYAPWVNVGGSYSVRWNDDPLELGIQDIFKTLEWSAVNSHTPKDLEMAKQLGKTLYIYNQGVTRYSFGLYQWAEMQKGVTGRVQWHMLALHGYQFYDLDGREPDTAMINWGRNEIIPTIHLPRCREGADDLRYAVTLWNACEKNKDKPEAQEARQWLEQISQQIPVNANRRPAGVMGDEEFRVGCAQRMQKILGK